MPTQKLMGSGQVSVVQQVKDAISELCHVWYFENMSDVRAVHLDADIHGT
jgi:hypothetical protein